MIVDLEERVNDLGITNLEIANYTLSEINIANFIKIKKATIKSIKMTKGCTQEFRLLGVLFDSFN